MRGAATLRFAALASLALVSGTVCAQSASMEPAGPFTIGAEVLVWWFKGSPTPAPVIVSDGAAGQPEARVLLGGGNVDTNANTGFRLFAGHRINPQWGVEGDFFYFPRRSTSSSMSSSGSDGSTDLLLPFHDVTRNRENHVNISFAPLYAGSARVHFTNKLMGAELMATWPASTATPSKVDLLGGFRWLQLKESYTITTSSPSIPPYPIDIWNTSDSFDASNNFYGAQFAVRGRYDQGPWSLNGTVKIGLGAMEQRVNVNGSLVTDEFSSNGATQTFPGGYFALPTNIGDHSRTVFAIVPEVKFNLGYRVTPATTVYIGYSFLYASKVARPGNQINRNINPTQSVSYVGDVPANLNGPAQPSFNFNSTSFRAQGVNVGLSVAF